MEVTMRKLLAFLPLLFGVNCAHAGDFPGFDGRYLVRTGDFNGDGRTDIYLQHDPKIIPIMFDELMIPVPEKAAVADFVLQQTPSGGFSAVSVAPSQSSALKQWAKTEAIKLIFGDYNADGLFDVIVKDILNSIPGVNDVIIFGPDSPTSMPTYVRNVDQAFMLFGKDATGWNEDPHYYDHGWYQACVQGWAWMPVAYLTEEGYWAYTYDWVLVSYCGWLFDPTGYSLPALYYLNAAVQQTTDQGGVERGSEPAITISDVLRDLLGVEYMRGIFRTDDPPVVGPKPYIPEGCENPQTGDEAEYCDNWYASRGLALMLRYIFIHGFDCFDRGPQQHYYEVHAPVCNVGMPRCNVYEVYQNESLDHPVVGYWDAKEPIWDIQQNRWTSAAPNGLGWAAMNCTDDIPGACDTMWVKDGGPIFFTVNPPLYTHRNTTMAGHIFDPGFIDRTVSQRGGQVWIDTVGQGTGACPRTNEKGGTEIFNTLDSFIRCHLAGGCHIKHPVGH